MTLKSGTLPVDRVRKNQPIAWLAIFAGMTVMLYLLVNGYCKHLETYDDERIYYSLAEGLAKGIGFPTIVGEPYDYKKRYLYSILISPAFLVRNRLLQFRLITLINALVMCSGAFPTYLLAKEVLKDSRTALLTGVLYLLQPDLQFTASFMSENLWLPLALWAILFSYQLALDDSKDFKKKSGYMVGWLLASILLAYVKSSGYVVVITSGIWLLIVLTGRLSRSIKLHQVKGQRLVFWILIILAAAMSALISFRYSWFGKTIINYIQSRILHEWLLKPWLHVRCYLFTWASEILAIGIFPMILPLLTYRKLSREGKCLYCFLLLLTAIANLGIVNTSIRSQELYHHTLFPVFHRYIIYIWLPYLIVFFDSLKSKAKPSSIGAGITLALTVLFCALFHGAVFGNAFEASLLWWARGWTQHRWPLVLFVIFYTTSGFFLLQYRRKYFVFLFAAVMLCLQAYNHFAMYTNIHGAYQFAYDDIYSVESFIRDRPEKTFLIPSLLSAKNGDQVEFYYSGKAADTFLLYPNSYFVSASKIIGTESENGTDLNSSEITLSGRGDLRSIDYVILPNEMFIDWKNCEPVMESRYFSIYQLEDPNVLPYMGVIKWGREGTTVLNPRNGFLSWYKENGSPTFVSTDTQAHVLHGPYVTLPAGSYSITIHYSYNGEQDGRIGLMDLMGSAFTEGEYEAPAFSDQDSVSISFELGDACTRFEARLYAEAAGITIESIEVEYTAPRLEEAAVKPAPAA